MTYTKGPWVLLARCKTSEHQSDFCVHAGNSWIVGNVYEPNGEANARLISLALDLVAFVKEAEDIIDIGEVGEYNEWREDMSPDEAYDTIERIIRRARELLRRVEGK